jgi:hypothetical protein
MFLTLAQETSPGRILTERHAVISEISDPASAFADILGPGNSVLK